MFIFIIVSTIIDSERKTRVTRPRSVAYPRRSRRCAPCVYTSTLHVPTRRFSRDACHLLIAVAPATTYYSTGRYARTACVLQVQHKHETPETILNNTRLPLPPPPPPSVCTGVVRQALRLIKKQYIITIMTVRGLNASGAAGPVRPARAVVGSFSRACRPRAVRSIGPGANRFRISVFFPSPPLSPR